MMKKTILTMIALLTVSVSTGFASPINNLENGQTAIGVIDDSVYLEHKLSDQFTLGIQRDDIYGQFQLSNNVRAIVGSRNNNPDSEMYVGLGVTTSLAPSLDGYASFVSANTFSELQVGANYNLTHDVDLNLNYRSLSPEYGYTSNRTSIGATVKF